MRDILSTSRRRSGIRARKRGSEVRFWGEPDMAKQAHRREHLADIDQQPIDPD
jgi:hypothetical protein